MAKEKEQKPLSTVSKILYIILLLVGLYLVYDGLQLILLSLGLLTLPGTQTARELVDTASMMRFAALAALIRIALGGWFAWLSFKRLKGLVGL